jgi:hypothetical protein
VRRGRREQFGDEVEKQKAAGGVLADKQAPTGPDTAPAHGLRADGVALATSQTNRERKCSRD